MSIPASVIIVTRDEGQRLHTCLSALKNFHDIWIVDTGGASAVAAMASAYQAKFVDYQWNGQYPKKRQWCLDHLALAHDWVFFVDADEIVTDGLVAEIEQKISEADGACGFFVEGKSCYHGKVLRFGIPNLKIALFHRKRMAFPVVDDLDIQAMGEIEGHYQPVPIDVGNSWRIGRLQHHLIHDTMDDDNLWWRRHERYAAWEVAMNKKEAWPRDPVRWRELAKQFLRGFSGRPEFMFIVAFIIKGGFLDGCGGFRAAFNKFRYYRMIRRNSQ